MGKLREPKRARHKAADTLRVDPSHCVVFEDAISGIEAAGLAGMKAAALATSLAAGEFQMHPAVICIARDDTSLQPRALLDAATRP